MNENQDLIKLLQESQKSQRWNTIGTILLIAASLITNLILIWKTFKKDKPSVAERMRREEEIQARSKLRMKALKREAEHETELNQIKSGLNSLSDLEEKGEELVQKQAEQTKKIVEDQIKDAKSKLKDFLKPEK